MQALFAWYEDQTGYTTEALNQQRQQEAAAQQQLQQQQQAQQQATKTPGNSRSLRQRKAHTPLPGVLPKDVRFLPKFNNCCGLWAADSACSLFLNSPAQSLVRMRNDAVGRLLQDPVDNS